MSLEMIGPASARGDRAFGLAEVQKVYRDRLVPPTKAVIREISGGHKQWRNSRPGLVMAQEESDANWRGQLKAGTKPRFPKSKNAAGYDAQNGRYYAPESVRFGVHHGDPASYSDSQRVGTATRRGVAKTFIPDAGKVTPDKGYQPAAIPATKLAAPARATRLMDLRRGQGHRAKEARRAKGKVPLYSRGKLGREYDAHNGMMEQLNQAPTTPSKTHKKLRFAEGVSPEHQASIESSLPRKMKRPVTFHNADEHGLPPRLGGVTFGRTGPAHTSHILVPPKADPQTIHHEYEHSQPKRSFGRVANLQQDSLLRGREEGRADVGAIRAHGLKRKAHTQYEQHAELNRSAKGGNKIAAAAFRLSEGDPEFTRGYDEVRTKMGMPHRGVGKLPTPFSAAIRAENASRAVAGGVQRVRRLFGKADVEKKGGVEFALGRTVKPRGAGLSHPAAPFQSRLHFGGVSSPIAPKNQRMQLNRQMETQVNPPARWPQKLGKPYQAQHQKPLLEPKASDGGVTTEFNQYKLDRMKTIRSGRTARQRSRGEKPGFGGMGNFDLNKVDTTMSDADAKRLATRYDTRGPLPKQLSRDQRMKAYEARYIASGGKEGEKWQRRANAAEVSRNIGLAGATAGAALTLAGRHKRLAPHLKKVGITHHRADNAALGAAAYGGASELYGEHARAKRASFRNSPAGVAGSALSRMQAYTPEKKKP